MKTTVPLKGGYVNVHLSLGECLHVLCVLAELGNVLVAETSVN